MTTDAALEVRPSRLKEGGWLGAFVLLLVGFGAFGDPKTLPLYLGLGLLITLLSSPVFFDTAPRLVLTDEGLSWRERKKDPLVFLAWTEIVSADIKAGGDDEPRRLRLAIASPPILQSIASGRERSRTIDIPVERLTLSDRQLIVAIHRRAPHLFTRVSRHEA